MRVLLLLPVLALAQDAEALLESARARAAKEDFVGAVIDYTRALAADPRLAPARVGRAKARRELKDVDGAIEDATAALEIDPRDIEAHVVRGACRADRQDHAAAVADYTRAIELGADGPLAPALRGISRVVLERYAESLPDLDLAISGGHRSPLVYLSRGVARLHLMELRGAVSDATRSLQRQPKNARALNVRSLAYVGLGSWENALRDLRSLEETGEPRSVLSAIWTHLVRGRMGEREAAAKELREVREALPKNAGEWVRGVLDFLLGDIGEADLLKAAEGPRALQAHLFIGHRLLMEGRSEEAAAHLERAVGEGPPGNDVHRVLARSELETIRLARRRAVLDDLERRFRELKPFHAEFRASGLTGSKDGKAVSTFEVWYDRAAPRLHVSLRGRDEKTGQDWVGHIASEGLSFLAWGVEDRSIHVDAASFFRGLETWGREFQAEFDRLLPAGPHRKDEPPMESTLVLDLEAKLGKDHEGSFRFAVGKGGRPANWLREPRRPAAVEMKVNEDEVVFEFPSARKTMVVDRATGFLRRLRVVDFDGVVREVVMTSLRPIERFPDPARPARFEKVPLHLAQVESRWREHVGWLDELLAEALDRWDDVTKAGKQKEVQALVIRWAARYADTLRTYALKSMARVYLRQKLDQGVPFADLGGEEEAARFAEACKAERETVEKFLRQRLDELAADVETRAIEAPIDSRRHGALGELLKASFEYRTVDAERSRSYGDRTGESYREELEELKKL